MRAISHKHLPYKVIAICVSILLTLIFAWSGAFERLIIFLSPLWPLASFIIGIFFTSVFTTALSIAAFAELTQQFPLIPVALIGSLGAVIGDMLIFVLFRDSLTDPFEHTRFSLQIHQFFLRPRVKFLAPFAGACIIASPLPDELGLMLMGLSHTKVKGVIAISFIMNFIGIVIIGLIARAVV